MRVLHGFLIVLGVTLLGVLAPLLFGGIARDTIGMALVCDALNKGVSKGYLTADSRKKLIEAVAASADVDDKSKMVAGRAAGGCGS